jgi:hypothetical protein
MCKTIQLTGTSNFIRWLSLGDSGHVMDVREGCVFSYATDVALMLGLNCSFLKDVK